MSELPPNLRPGAFAGLADDYVRYRVPYPRAMLDAVLAEARLAPAPRLLDLACGPGRVSLPIAGRFAGVTAIDQEPDMIAAGRREAARLGVGNIRWLVGRAEDLEAPPASFDLVTVGEAFHRLDRPRVARLAFGWLKRGGAFVTMGMGPIPGAAPPPWRPVVAAVVRDFVGEPARRLGAPNATPDEELADQERAIREAGFDVTPSRDVPVTHEWTLASLLGNARSMSVTSARALGDRHAAFESALTKALLAFDPSGRYAEVIGAGYPFARRP